MLWHKSWLETRWRFAIGLVLMLCVAAAIVLVYPKVRELLPAVAERAASGSDGALGRDIRASIAVAGDYRGYVWSQWFAKELSQIWVLFAALLGSGGLVTQAARGGALFTLALPVSRNRLFAVRAATGLVELAAIAVVPSLAIALLSPVIGEHYAVGDAILHAGCVFVAGSVFFALASLLSTAFADAWRPPLIAIAAAIGLGLAAQVFPAVSQFSVFPVMSAERYFEGGGVPWAGLAISAAVSAAMLYGAARNLARQDF